MITLDNISLETLHISWYEPKYYDYLWRLRAKSVQDVIDNKDLLGDQDHLKRINSKIIEVKKKVELLNEKGNELKIYKTDRTNWFTDKKNSGEVLLLTNPTSDYSVRQRILEYKPIEKIKDDLGLMNVDGQNYLVFSYKKIGEAYLVKLLKALEMYDEQVLKQSKETKDINNIFTYNHDEKATIVSYNYEDIINYFVDNNRDLIWGDLSDNQKRAYLSSVTRKTQADRKTRKRINNYIANYTTLDELNNIQEDDYKLLNKFIK